uniref:Uncharacterized protein n=1 Tax=Anguilla anguilla TaxID=7936 RepID=A0A0E9XE74_ANGAN
MAFTKTRHYSALFSEGPGLLTQLTFHTFSVSMTPHSLEEHCVHYQQQSPANNCISPEDNATLLNLTYDNGILILILLIIIIITAGL